MTKLPRFGWQAARLSRAREVAGLILLLSALLWPSMGAALPSTRWTFGFDGTRGEDSAAQVLAAGETLFVTGRTQLADGSFETFVAALGARSGRPIWRKQLNLAGDLERTRDLVWVAGQLIVGSDGHGGADSALAVLDAKTGQIQWQVSIDREARGRRLYALTANADTVFSASGDERERWAVEARALSSGALRWADQGSEPGDPRRLMPRDLTLAGDLLVVVGTERTSESADPPHRTLVRAHDVQTGELRWQDQTPGTADTDEVGLQVGAADGVVVVASQTRNADEFRAVNLRGLDAETGELRWQTDIAGQAEETFARLHMAPPFIVVATNARSGTTQSAWLRRIRLEDGKIDWETRAAQGDSDTRIEALAVDRGEIVAGGAIWTDADDPSRPNAARGWALALDLATGTRLWERTLDAEGSAGGVTTLALIDGYAYLGGWGNPGDHANAIVRSLGPQGRPRVLPRRSGLQLGDTAPGRGAPAPRRQRIPEQKLP